MRLCPTALLVLTLAACADPVAPPVPAELTVLHGPGAVSVPGQRFDTVAIRLTADDGTPIVGWPVTWSGDGTVEPYDSVTDVVGIARARWTLPRYDLVSPDFHISGPSGNYTAHAEAIGFGGHQFTVEARAFRVDRVDAAFHYACGIRSGDLWCWGQVPLPVGLAPPVRVPVPVTLPAGVVPVDLRVTESVACILDSAGTPWCATSDAPGQFRQVPGAPALTKIDGAANAHGISVEDTWFCGRSKQPGLPWCWRYDPEGTPRGAFIGTRPMIEVVAGSLFGCGIDTQQVTWCWGRNDRGQLGDGSSTDRSAPVAVAGGLAFEHLTANNLGVCGSTLDHQVYCWGWSYFPETHVPRLVAAPAMVGPDITLGGTGELYSIVNGDLRIWFNEEDLPLFAEVGRLWITQVAGDGQSCVRARDGEVFCSWILLRGGGDTSIFTADLVPVPDPASVTP